jgi:hypothetical protein
VLQGATTYEGQLSALAAQAASLVASLTSDVEAVALPTLTLTGPSSPAAAGAPTSLTAAAAGGTGALRIAWDLDLDGAFDDATGAATSLTLPQAQNQLVGARVTDVRGLSNTRYLRVTATAANLQPAVTPTPAAPHVTVTGGTSQTFSVTATDPENDPLTYRWYLDDATIPVATGPEYTHSTADGERSLHAVTVVVDDGNPTHGQPHAGWALTTRP